MRVSLIAIDCISNTHSGSVALVFLFFTHVTPPVNTLHHPCFFFFFFLTPLVFTVAETVSDGISHHLAGPSGSQIQLLFVCTEIETRRHCFNNSACFWCFCSSCDAPGGGVGGEIETEMFQICSF